MLGDSSPTSFHLGEPSTIGEDGIEERSAAYQRLMRELLRGQRRVLIELRNEGRIGDEAMHRIERDLEESRLER